jgi:hypothetical protein
MLEAVVGCNADRVCQRVELAGKRLTRENARWNILPAGEAERRCRAFQGREYAEGFAFPWPAREGDPAVVAVVVNVMS